MVNRRILVVDDLALARQGAALLIESIGYDVDQAESGLEAIELFKAGEYAAIIMDYNMPKMNGFECVAKLRELEKSTGSHTPIICMSSSDAPDMKEQCIEAGLDDFLEKNCSGAELAATLLHWVS